LDNGSKASSVDNGVFKPAADDPVYNYAFPIEKLIADNGENVFQIISSCFR
jgi:hypothetical protein